MVRSDMKNQVMAVSMANLYLAIKVTKGQI